MKIEFSCSECFNNWTCGIIFYMHIKIQWNSDNVNTSWNSLIFKLRLGASIGCFVWLLVGQSVCLAVNNSVEIPCHLYSWYWASFYRLPNPYFNVFFCCRCLGDMISWAVWTISNKLQIIYFYSQMHRIYRKSFSISKVS